MVLKIIFKMPDKGEKALFDNSATIVMPKVLSHIGKVLVRVDVQRNLFSE